jgi:sporulation protein YlmC with PRC-barrel domain
METLREEYERENQTGANPDGNENMPVERLTATSIIGDKVENFEGEDLGEIKNLMVNLELGCVEYAVLEYGGIMGMGSKLFAIPYKALTLDPERKVFLLNRDKESLKNAPGFDKDHWPNTNSHYEAVNTYWGNFMGPNTGAAPL